MNDFNSENSEILKILIQIEKEAKSKAKALNSRFSKAEAFENLIII
jgi:hypothetical protein